MKCQEKSKYCNNEDVRLCQMKSASRPVNVYEGKKVYMCKECRAMQQGQYKFVK